MIKLQSDTMDMCSVSSVSLISFYHKAPSQYKGSLSRYGDSHHKDKMVSWLSYLYKGNSYTGKMYLYIETALWVLFQYEEDMLPV